MLVTISLVAVKLIVSLWDISRYAIKILLDVLLEVKIYLMNKLAAINSYRYGNKNALLVFKKI